MLTMALIGCLPDNVQQVSIKTGTTFFHYLSNLFIRNILEAYIIYLSKQSHEKNIVLYSYVYNIIWK